MSVVPPLSIIFIIYGFWAYYLFFRSGTATSYFDNTRQIFGLIFTPIFMLYCAWVIETHKHKGDLKEF